MAKALPPKRKLFAEFYAETGNGAESYRRAGYACKTDKVATVESSRLLANPSVRAYIDELTEKAAKPREVTRESILSELAKVGFDSDQNERVKTSDKVKSLELLGKRFGLWIERHQHEGPGWQEIFEKLSPATRRTIIEELEALEGDGD